MSIRFNFQDEFVKFLFSEYPIEVLSLKISDIKSLNFDNEYTLYENYRLISDKYFAYPLLPKEDSSLNSPDIIEYGHFPTNGQEVIINQGFAHTYYPGIPFEDIIGRPLICSGNSFIIAGILSDLTQGNKVDIVYYLNYYQAVDQPQHYEQPTVFIPYETIVQVGEIVDSEYKVIKFEGLYGNWDTVEIFRQKCGGVLSPWDRDILESQTLIEKVFLIVIGIILVLSFIALIFLNNQIHLDLFYRRKELGYLQIFNVPKRTIRRLLLLEYEIKIILSLLLALLAFVFIIVIAHVFLNISGWIPTGYMLFFSLQYSRMA